MLLTKEAKVKLNAANIEYYKNLGYEIPVKKASESTRKRHGKDFVYDLGKTMNIKIEDLPKNSGAKVEVLCDICKENIISVKYADYNKVMERTGSYVCRPCSYKKRDQTNLEKYGSKSYLGTKECKQKTEEIMIERYGVPHYTQTQEYREKYHNTCVKRYGESYNKHFREKAINTLYENTGYAHAMQNPVIKDMVKNTNLKKYGVVCTLQVPEVREKVVKAFYENSSVATSKQQRYICNLYNGILNYPVRYYNVDVYLPNDRMTIEYDGSGHLLGVFTGDMTMEEFNQREIIRNTVIKKEGYKQMRIISSRDYLPSDDTLLQMLQCAKDYFYQYPSHSWIEFNIDTFTLRNAEHKDGILYDFGKLRRINNAAEVA